MYSRIRDESYKTFCHIAIQFWSITTLKSLLAVVAQGLTINQDKTLGIHSSCIKFYISNCHSNKQTSIHTFTMELASFT